MSEIFEDVQEQALALQAAGLHSREALRAAIELMQDSLMAHPASLGENPYPLKHQFADGVYLRQIFIPQGYIIVGKIHKTRHAIFLSVGDLSILTEEGVKRVKGPAIFISEPGTKRIAYAHEDTLWTNVHATTETDIDKIEDQVIAKSYAELEKT